MKATFYLIALVIMAASQLSAQVTFLPYATPVGFDDNYRLVVDYYTDNQILFPVATADTFYVKGTAGGFVPKASGLYITAFYADNGDLYLVENTTPAGHTPKLMKSTDNGGTFTEITGVSGRVFERDHRGNLFYGVPGGFAYSTDDGANFTTVATADTVFSAAFSPPNRLYYLSDSARLYKSTDDGSNWQTLSKTGAFYFERQQSLHLVNDTFYYQGMSAAYFSAENASVWSPMYFTPSSSIFTYLTISPDLAFHGYGAYGYFTSNTPQINTWTPLSLRQGAPQDNIYNHFTAVTDSQMYIFTIDSGYFYAPRTPNAVGLDEIGDGEQLVAVYPNPTHGQVTITTSHAEGSFQLFNLQGQAVLTEPVQHHQQMVDVSHLAPGLYIWQLGSNKGKLLVEQE